MTFDPADISFLFEEEEMSEEVSTEKEITGLLEAAIFADAKRGEFETTSLITIDEEELGDLEAVCENFRSRGFEVNRLVKDIDGRMTTQSVTISWEKEARKSLEDLQSS